MGYKPNAPCEGCAERHVDRDYNCHTHCDKYLQFKKEVPIERRLYNKRATAVREYINDAKHRKEYHSQK